MKAISEFQFADVGPPAKTKRSGFRPAGELSFHPNAGLSPAIVSGNSRPRDYTLAGRRFIRRFLGIVTSASMPTKVRRQFFSGHRNGAEPGARANDQGWHASCRATSRASPDRGSSLTLGKNKDMFGLTPKEELKELHDLPQSSVGAPCPLVFATEHDLHVSYYLNAVEEGWVVKTAVTAVTKSN